MAVVEDAPAGRRAAARGATLIQLRARDLPARQLEREARNLVEALAIPLLINARPDVALATGAAGVHLPENDIPVAAARRLLPDRLVGRSTHSLEAALEAESEGADYVVFGPIFPTPSHEFSSPTGTFAQGLPALQKVASQLRIPVIAIGGVDDESRAACEEMGAAGFAAIRHWNQ
jgi:thiamine-phosphate pyrophosphorylase